VPLAQRSYLVGFLASITADDVAPPIFAPDPATAEPEADWADRYVTLAADALSAHIAAQQHVARLDKEVSELRAKVRAAELELEYIRGAAKAEDGAGGAVSRLRRILSGRA